MTAEQLLDDGRASQPRSSLARVSTKAWYVMSLTLRATGYVRLNILSRISMLCVFQEYMEVPTVSHLPTFIVPVNLTCPALSWACWLSQCLLFELVLYCMHFCCFIVLYTPKYLLLYYYYYYHHSLCCRTRPGWSGAPVLVVLACGDVWYCSVSTLSTSLDEELRGFYTVGIWYVPQSIVLHSVERPYSKGNVSVCSWLPERRQWDFA